MTDTTIAVNISRLIRDCKDALPTEHDVVKALAKLQAAGLDKWRTQADKRLTSTAANYKAALRSGATNGGRMIFIQLDGTRLVDMVENGWKGGDMRDWLLKSPKARTSRDGHKWLIVPFRHASGGTKKSKGEGSRTANVGNTMPASIHAAAKLLNPTVSVLDKVGKGATKWGGRLHEGSAGVNRDAHKLLTTLSKPYHATSIYQGIVRKTQPVNTAKGSTSARTSGYSSFRVISSKVKRDPAHWHHPGIKGAHIVKDVVLYLDKIAPETLFGIVRARMGQGSRA